VWGAAPRRHRQKNADVPALMYAPRAVGLRAAFESAKLPAEVEVYPAALGWRPPDTKVYDATQSERAWTRLLATFSAALGLRAAVR